MSDPINDARGALNKLRKVLADAVEVKRDKAFKDWCERQPFYDKLPSNGCRVTISTNQLLMLMRAAHAEGCKNSKP